MESVLAAPAWILAALSIGLAGLTSAGVVTLVRRILKIKPEEHHNEVLGMLMSAGGIFCAILVALAVFVVWDHRTTAQQAEVDEGAALIALYHDAETLPEPGQTTVEDSIRSYTASVIDDEFPSLTRGEASDRTQRRLSQMNAAVHRYLPTTSAPDQVSSIARSQYELELASDESMPLLLWALLVGGCILLLLMAAPLFMESVRYHTLGFMLLGATLGAALFLILVADHPFVGPLQVTPTDLEANLHTYQVIDGAVGGPAASATRSAKG